MRKFKLNKLVRDGVFENMKELGQQVDYKVLEDKKLVKALKQKLSEELAEFDPSGEEPLKELADLLEVIEALAEALGTNSTELKRLKKAKRTQKGGFSQHIFVRTVTIADNDPWIAYYTAHPDRFPEISNK